MKRSNKRKQNELFKAIYALKHDYKLFKKSVKGDPTKIIEEMLKSGKMSKEDFAKYKMAADTLLPLFQEEGEQK